MDDRKLEDTKSAQELYERKLAETKRTVLGFLADFMATDRDTLMNYVGDHELCGQVLSLLQMEGRIRYDGNCKKYYHCGYGEENVDRMNGMDKALAVYLSYRSIGANNYVVSPDRDILMTFEYKGLLVDVVYVRYGTETNKGNILHMKERYLSPKDREKLCRIVIVDMEKQIPEIDIAGTQYYVIVDKDGNSRYIKPVDANTH